MLQQGGGLLLHTASVQSYMGEAGFSAYQCAKGGILSLARSIALDHAPTIRSVAGAPGFIHTAGARRHPGRRPSSAWWPAIPAWSWSRRPEEVAALCCAYSPRRRPTYITGPVVIDGGVAWRVSQGSSWSR
jgi:NAD(P)-dependent dehydrogenase (short-subunit alcohol dehydrogenase family)